MNESKLERLKEKFKKLDKLPRTEENLEKIDVCITRMNALQSGSINSMSALRMRDKLKRSLIKQDYEIKKVQYGWLYREDKNGENKLIKPNYCSIEGITLVWNIKNGQVRFLTEYQYDRNQKK